MEHQRKESNIEIQRKGSDMENQRKESKIKNQRKESKIENQRKGSNGVTLLIAGSELYTGSAYLVCQSAFKTGTDLVYIMTSGDRNIISLKTLCPEAIVIDVQSYFKYKWIFARVTCVVFGPGLSRAENIKNFEVLDYFIDERPEIPIIVDGDGFYLMAKYQNYRKDCKRFKNLFLTPNFNEVNFRIESLGENVYKIEKGPVDKIFADSDIFCEISEFGCKRRCAGQGDILVGILSSFLNKPYFLFCINICALSSLFMRFAAKRCYGEKKFSMMARDILEYLDYESLVGLIDSLASDGVHAEMLELLSRLLDD